jgi:hypothetical protein
MSGFSIVVSDDISFEQWQEMAYVCVMFMGEAAPREGYNWQGAYDAGKRPDEAAREALG